MDELRVEVALEIIQLKIVHLLKDNKNNRDTIKKELDTLIEEREKIYDLDEKTINKVYDIYLKEIKNKKEG